MTKRIKHPLLENSPAHYNTRERPDIMVIEDKLSVCEMIGACKFNLSKYDLREKGQNEADIFKAKVYSNYLKFLYQFDVKSYIVSDAMRNHNLAWIEDPTFTEPA